VIPAAAVMGGGGAGGGEDPETKQTGGGTGFGLSARPVGAYVIDNGTMRWEPATDTTRLIVIAEMLAAIVLIATRVVRG
jgi:uncharacterized spore protein YtfJ